MFKRVIVTGASGLIGKHCLKHLAAADFEVHALSRSGNNQPKDNIAWHKLDILDLGGVDNLITDLRPSHLLHLAWYTAHPDYWSSLHNLSYISASTSLIKKFLQVGGERIVAAGTCAEYDWSSTVFDEDQTPTKPLSLYGGSKLSVLQLLRSCAEQDLCSFAWGRVFWAFGPFEDSTRLLPYVINSVLRNERADCSDGLQVRDLLYADDAARYFAQLADNDFNGVINIASGTGTKLRDAITIIARLLHREELVSFGTRSAPPNDPPSLVANVDKLSELGLVPNFDLETGLSKTIDWWQEELRKTV